MATSKSNRSVKIRDLGPMPSKYGVGSRFEEYYNILINNLTVSSNSGDALTYEVEHFIKDELLSNGQVGYDKLTGRWYRAFGYGLNDYGNYSGITFRVLGDNSYSFTRKASYINEVDGAYIIKGLPTGMAMASIIKETTDFMTNCDIAMRQNLEACKTPYIVVCRDEDMRLSFRQALQQKELGQACIIVSEELGEGLKAVNVGCEFLVDKFREARDAERDILLNKLGILTANTDKRERLLSSEVYSTLGQATDYIYTIIDTFNKQCRSYGIPYTMSFNGSMEELYNADAEEDTTQDIEEVTIND